MPLMAIGLGLGAIGGIFGSINSSNSQNQATQAASAASAGQQQLTQEQLAIYQQLLQQYNTNVQPLQGPLGSEYGDIEQILNPASQTLNYENALANPDAGTGYQETTLTDNVLNYLQNTGGTHAEQVADLATPVLESGMQGNSNLGQMTPGAISSLLSGGITGNNANPGVGASAVDYYLNQAQNGGINPLLMNNALGQQSTANARDINDIRNSMGGTSNIGALLQNQNLNNNQSTASLIAQMTGQSAQMETAAEGSALTAAQSTDAANNSATNQALTAADNEDNQTLEYIMSTLQAAGGLDAQTMSMLTGAQAMGSQAEQTQLNNLGTAQATTGSLLSQIQNYLAQGQAGATGVATGLAGAASQYGQSATAAASNAAAAAAGTNPFAGLGSSLSNYAAYKSATPTPAPTSLTGVGQQVADGSSATQAPYQMAGEGNLYG